MNKFFRGKMTLNPDETITMDGAMAVNEGDTEMRIVKTITKDDINVPPSFKNRAWRELVKLLYD